MVVTTLSFRSAYLLGVPNLAGTAVTLHPHGQGLAVFHGGRLLGHVGKAADARRRGGLPPRRDRPRKPWREPARHWPPLRALTVSWRGVATDTILGCSSDRRARSAAWLGAGLLGLEIAPTGVSYVFSISALKGEVRRRRTRPPLKIHTVEIHTQGSEPGAWIVRSKERWFDTAALGGKPFRVAVGAFETIRVVVGVYPVRGFKPIVDLFLAAWVSVMEVTDIRARAQDGCMR